MQWEMIAWDDEDDLPDSFLEYLKRFEDPLDPYHYEPEDRPDRLTLGQLANQAGVSYAFAREAVSEDLIRPDAGRQRRKKRYRRRLASWLSKLYQLKKDGLSWEDIRAWARRRARSAGGS